MADKHVFDAKIEQSDSVGAGAWIMVPEDVMHALGGKRVKVFCEFDGEPYRGTVLNMGLGPCIGILKEIREKIGKQRGDSVRVTLWKDELERIVDMPDDLRSALEENGLKAAFDSLSYTRRKEHALSVAGAKRDETRKSRIDKIVFELSAKPALVIFDMDGLMFGTEQIAIDAWHIVLPAHGYKPDNNMILGLLGRNALSVKQRFLDFYGEDFPYDEINGQRIDECDRVIEQNGMPVKPGLYNLLDLLDEMGIKKAVATSTSRPGAMFKLKKGGVAERFNTIVCGDEVSKSKPEPDIFLEAALRLKIKPAMCMVLEDSESGIRAAHAAGMRPILVPDVIRPPEEAAKLAYKECVSLNEVAELIRSYSFIR